MQKITWDGVEIEINYVENFSNVYEKIYGERMCHIEIYVKENVDLERAGKTRLFFVPDFKIDGYLSRHKITKSD